MTPLDTNIFIRYLTRDDPTKAQACQALLQRVQAGQESITTEEVIIAEVVYVLASPALYHLSHADIAARLAPIIRLHGLRLAHKRTYLRALDLYAAHAFLDFEDALLVAHMERRGLTTLMSYDQDFDRIPGITREEP